jgi:hypothetical protein
MADKPSRESFIAVLQEAGKSPTEINAALVAAGYTPILSPKLKAPKPSVQAAEIADPLPTIPGDPVEGPTPEHAAAAAVLLEVIGKTDKGKPITRAAAQVTTALYFFSDLVRVLYPEVHKKYHAIKYPSGEAVPSTPAQKRAAYLFLCEQMLDLLKI